MTPRLGAYALALGTALLLAGCGDDTAVGPLTDPGSTPPAVSVTPSPTETASVGSDITTPVVPAKYASSGGAWFETPSGRISCLVLNELVTCEVGDVEWEVPAADEPCELDLVPSVLLSGRELGKAYTSCQGDTNRGGPALDYGTTLTAGVISCTSERTGLTCRNTVTKHGFTVSRTGFTGF